MVKQNATLDSSFWIHIVACSLVDYLIEDFDVWVTDAVRSEMKESYGAGARLHTLIRAGNLRIENAKSAAIGRFGPGERAAISLALERREWTLLIDDVRPFRAAIELGLQPICSPSYVASLHQRGVIEQSAALSALALLSARSTVSPELLTVALNQVK